LSNEEGGELDFTVGFMSGSFETATKNSIPTLVRFLSYYRTQSTYCRYSTRIILAPAAKIIQYPLKIFSPSPLA
jgi:hypothetical protein